MEDVIGDEVFSMKVSERIFARDGKFVKKMRIYKF